MPKKKERTNAKPKPKSQPPARKVAAKTHEPSRAKAPPKRADSRGKRAAPKKASRATEAGQLTRRGDKGKPVAVKPKAESQPVVEEITEQAPIRSVHQDSLAEKLRQRKDPGIDTSPHLIVIARAGTGKSTTLVEGLKRIKDISSELTPSPQQAAVWEAMQQSKGKAQTICFVAFNKGIAVELQSRVPEGCDAMTMHSLGFKAINRAFERVKVNGYRVQDIISELLETDIRELRRIKPVVVKATEDLVGLCKQNLVGYQDEHPKFSLLNSPTFNTVLSKLASHYDVELDGRDREVFELVPRVLERCLDVSTDRCIDFNDMIWLPTVLDLPVYKYDLLLVDEAQDLNRCQQELAMRAGRRLILCGDPKQAIYGFAGADSQSMDNMAIRLGATDRGVQKLPLTVTRRCSKAVVAEAQKIVEDFEAFETNPEGLVLHTTLSEAGFVDTDHNRSSTVDTGGGRLFINFVNDGDFLLCRVNAPLVSHCFRFLKAGRKANIQGRDIGQGLIKMLERFKAADVSSLMLKLDDWYQNECKAENAKRNPNEQRLITLQDKHSCLLCFCEDAQSVQQVLDRIETIFSDSDKGGVRLASIHKSKGLEADRVFLLMPKGASIPHPMAKTAMAKDQETNCLYVGITRAISELYFVRDKV